jgi:hypothetical protein
MLQIEKKILDSSQEKQKVSDGNIPEPDSVAPGFIRHIGEGE